jgi:acyl-coenzyme A synthetase/AMP-(fatty) acid ligase
LRAVFSTGSPLVAEAFDYVYANIKADIQLASVSGGTDIISCFVIGNPNGPVHRGEIQCAGLGMAVDVFDDEGNPVRGKKGRTSVYPKLSRDANRLLERRGWREVPRRLFRTLPEFAKDDLVSRRFRRDHETQWLHHLWPFGCDA